MEHARADIIPTRQRADLLQKALRMVTSQDDTKLEITVSYNFCSDGTQDIVRSIADSRRRDVNLGRWLNMSHNCELALAHVSDGRVTIIGDYDRVLPHVLQEGAQMAKAPARCHTAHFQHRLARDTDRSFLQGEHRGMGDQRSISRPCAPTLAARSERLRASDQREHVSRAEWSLMNRHPRPCGSPPRSQVPHTMPTRGTRCGS